MQKTVKHRNRISKTILAFGSLIAVLLAFICPPFQWGAATRAAAVTPEIQQLPITAFTNLLRPTSFDFWLDPATGNVVAIDTFGKLNQTFGLNLGTIVSGRVTIRDLGDGTQQVVIEGFTENALCFGFNDNNGNIEPAFGYGRAEVQNNVGPAALGRGIFRFNVSPQPVGPISWPWPLESLIVNLTCDGLLRAGSGYPEGTPGFAQTTQTGLFVTGVPSGCPPEHDADCFPAEKVQFKATGN